MIIVSVSDTAIRRVYGVVFAIDAFLIVMTALSDLKIPFAVSKLAAQADLKQEGVFAVWYSSLLLLLDSMAALCIAQCESTAPTQRASYRWRWAWTAAALAFLGLSIDETAQIHERAGYVFSLIVGRIPGLTDQYVVFGWLVLFLPLIIVFAGGMVLLVRTWLAFHSLSRWLAFAAGACWGGVLLAEFFEAQVQRYGREVGLLGVVEESLEIAGATLFFISFTEYLRAIGKRPAASQKQPTSAPRG